MTFAPIGQISEQNAQSVAGKPLGETGSLTASQPSSAIAGWLGAKVPADMDKAAELRAQLHGVTLAVKYDWRFPSGPNGEHLPSYQVAVDCVVRGTTEQRLAAKADLENFMMPAPIRQIEMWLAELSVITAGRGPDGINAELLLTAYSGRLAKYPADVARAALLDRSWKWFPTWAELEKVCNALAGPRRHMIAALMHPEPDPEPERRAPTQDEKDRIAALISELFPDVPQHWREAAAREVTKGECIADTAKGAE